MLMNSGNEILVGGGLRALLLLAAFCRVKWNRSNMLTDVDMPVALATSAPVFVAAASKAASGSGPICCTDCSICLYLFFRASSLDFYPLSTLCSCSRIVTSATIHSCFMYMTSGIEECSLSGNCA